MSVKLEKLRNVLGMPNRKIEIYDTTLRDGNQGEGINLSLGDKLDIAVALDDMGIDFIEGGWPGSNPKDDEFFSRVHQLNLSTSRIVAFGSTHRSDVTPDNDYFLEKLINANADVTCIFGKTWDLHVEQALRVSPEKNIDMISGSISYLIEATGKPVFYDAEHFFDGFKSDENYALSTIQAALDAGASRIVLCDTNGGVLPHELAHAIASLLSLVPEAKLGIHVHNDGGLGVANTLRAIEAGVIQVHGTINGIGERCGNVDLTSVIGNLELKMGYQCIPSGKLSGLTHLSKTVWEYIGSAGPSGQPFVGPSAFAHKGGVHVSAVQRNPKTYEHIEPGLVGNARKVLISELAGGSNLKAKFANRYQELEDGQAVKAILEEVQNREHAGYSFENADGSFDLLVRRHIDRYNPLFDPLYYRIYSPSNEEHEDSDGQIEASVKIKIDDEVRLCAAEGNGPVDALNHALQKALMPDYPVLSDLHLTDYKVKVINNTQEAAAKVRVYIEHSFQGETFGTVGVNVDIIKASWNALIEAYQYTLMQSADFQQEIQESHEKKTQ